MTTQIGVLDSYLSQNDKKISLYRTVSFILKKKKKILILVRMTKKCWVKFDSNHQ